MEIKGPRIDCYLDNKLVHSVTRKGSSALAATAGLSDRGDELILKVVNGGPKSLATGVSLRGVEQVESRAPAIVLTGGSADDENSFNAPARVVPRNETVENMGPNFRHEFPAYSVTILRMKLAK